MIPFGGSFDVLRRTERENWAESFFFSKRLQVTAGGYFHIGQ